MQWVNRPHFGFSRLCRLHRQRARPGQAINRRHSSGRLSKVTRVIAADGDVEEAGAGEAVTLTVADEVDIARGDVLAHPDSRPEVADQFAAHVIWMSEEQLLPGRSYLMKIGMKTTPATITELRHRIDVNTLEKLAGKTLSFNEVGFCNLATTMPVADPYADNRETGAFILIDRSTNETAAAGLIAHGLRRAPNVHRQELGVRREARAQLKHQRPAILWFTGLSGAGKSVVANHVETQLHARGAHTLMLDGDNVRHGLNKDLGFTAVDRVENIRRVGEVARLMTDAGLIVLCSFISPFRAERALVRDFGSRASFLKYSSTRRWHYVSRAIPRGCIGAHWLARSRISPASISPMSRRKTLISFSSRRSRHRRPSPARSSANLKRADSSF